MASSNSAENATPQPETSKPEPVPIEVYIISYHAEEWSNGVRLLDGREPPGQDWGSLGAQYSLSDAQDVGTEWALKQLQDRLQRQSPPLETDKDREAAFDDWDKTESTEGDFWSYTISKDSERLLTKVQKFIFYDPHRFQANDAGKGVRIAEEGKCV